MSTIGVLQRLKELFLGSNWLPSASLKEFAALKFLNILDLSNNKLSADLEKWNKAFKYSQMRQLKVLNVKGNQQLLVKMTVL